MPEEEKEFLDNMKDDPTSALPVMKERSYPAGKARGSSSCSTVAVDEDYSRKRNGSGVREPCVSSNALQVVYRPGLVPSRNGLALYYIVEGDEGSSVGDAVDSWRGCRVAGAADKCKTVNVGDGSTPNCEASRETEGDSEKKSFNAFFSEKYQSVYGLRRPTPAEEYYRGEQIRILRKRCEEISRKRLHVYLPKDLFDQCIFVETGCRSWFDTGSDAKASSSAGYCDPIFPHCKPELTRKVMVRELFGDTIGRSIPKDKENSVKKVIQLVTSAIEKSISWLYRFGNFAQTGEARLFFQDYPDPRSLFGLSGSDFKKKPSAEKAQLRDIEGQQSHIHVLPSACPHAWRSWVRHAWAIVRDHAAEFVRLCDLLEQRGATIGAGRRKPELLGRGNAIMRDLVVAMYPLVYYAVCQTTDEIMVAIRDYRKAMEAFVNQSDCHLGASCSIGSSKASGNTPNSTNASPQVRCCLVRKPGSGVRFNLSSAASSSGLAWDAEVSLTFKDDELRCRLAHFEKYVRLYRVASRQREKGCTSSTGEAAGEAVTSAVPDVCSPADGQTSHEPSSTATSGDDELWKRFVATPSERRDIEERIYVMLKRYDSIIYSPDHHTTGGNMHAAAPEKVFHLLKDELSVRCECFASPNNCFFSTFFSAFPDTDGVFGSAGSFFDTVKLPGGCYEVGPPYTEEMLLFTIDHVEKILGTAEGESSPLTFLLFVPEWLDCPGIIRMRSSKWQTAELEGPGNKHVYVVGTQHCVGRSRSSRYYRPPHATKCFVLQNALGRAIFPMTEGFQTRIRLRMQDQRGGPCGASDILEPVSEDNDVNGRASLPLPLVESSHGDKTVRATAGADAPRCWWSILAKSQASITEFLSVRSTMPHRSLGEAAVRPTTQRDSALSRRGGPGGAAASVPPPLLPCEIEESWRMTRETTTTNGTFASRGLNGGSVFSESQKSSSQQDSRTETGGHNSASDLLRKNRDTDRAWRPQREGCVSGNTTAFSVRARAVTQNVSDPKFWGSAPLAAREIAALTPLPSRRAPLGAAEAIRVSPTAAKRSIAAQKSQSGREHTSEVLENDPSEPDGSPGGDEAYGGTSLAVEVKKTAAESLGGSDLGVKVQQQFQAVEPPSTPVEKGSAAPVLYAQSETAEHGDARECEADTNVAQQPTASPHVLSSYNGTLPAVQYVTETQRAFHIEAPVPQGFHSTLGGGYPYVMGTAPLAVPPYFAAPPAFTSGMGHGGALAVSPSSAATVVPYWVPAMMADGSTLWQVVMFASTPGFPVAEDAAQVHLAPRAYYPSTVSGTLEHSEEGSGQGVSVNQEGAPCGLGGAFLVSGGCFGGVPSVGLEPGSQAVTFSNLPQPGAPFYTYSAAAEWNPAAPPYVGVPSPVTASTIMGFPESELPSNDATPASPFLSSQAAGCAEGEVAARPSDDGRSLGFPAPPIVSAPSVVSCSSSCSSFSGSDVVQDPVGHTRRSHSGAHSHYRTESRSDPRASVKPEDAYDHSIPYQRQTGYSRRPYQPQQSRQGFAASACHSTRQPSSTASSSFATRSSEYPTGGGSGGSRPAGSSRRSTHATWSNTTTPAPFSGPQRFADSRRFQSAERSSQQQQRYPKGRGYQQSRDPCQQGTRIQSQNASRTASGAHGEA